MGATTVKAEARPAPLAHTANTWRSLRSEFDRIYDGFGDISAWSVMPARMFASAVGAAAPALELAEGDIAYTLTAELPGLSEADFKLSVANDRLTLTGEKHDAQERRMGHAYYSERTYGRFQRALMLPADVDQEHITADFRNGVLVVTLPKTEAVQPKAIKVKTG